ncbi:hypothetical protein HJ526_18255 [Donghicola sp. C2-DW-16]|uniref:Uncharacterized protein n=1 Tax=Donghicola mangrovi TaxID=2729614 RepID=A0ABX2PIL7_9RHOB|nr:hypothetical protein [Donghicola mangrovi]NVO29368.1 hypothetical protein [Donghicola mangrovi]
MTTTDQAEKKNLETFLAEIDQELSKVRPYLGWGFKRSGLEILHCGEPVCSLFRVKTLASAEDHSNTSFIIEVLTETKEVTEVTVPNKLLTRNAPAALDIMSDKGFLPYADAKCIRQMITT